MAISKVIFNGETLMDVTDDTVTAGTLLSPETATRADGVQITGAVVTTDDYTDLTNKPQINSVTLTGNKSLSDLGIAAASDLSGKQTKITASGILKGNGSGTVTAATAGTDYGTYSKPTGGIPKTDLATAVQTSLGKADTALQSAPVTSVNSKTGAVSLTASDVGAYAKPSTGIPKTDLASAVQTSLGKADTALQSAPVTSVNSKTGAVSLTASDVGAYVLPSGGIPATDIADGVIPDVSGFYTKPGTGIPKTDLASAVQTSLGKADTALQSAPVTSVNNKTGAVSLTASDVGAYTKPSTGIPKTDLASSIQTSLGKADTALQSAPVTSVNSKTGAVSLTASDVGAYVLPSGGIPKTDLASAVQTSLGKADTALQSAPVTSVNSKTGAVSLTASDVGAYTKPSTGIPKTDLASAVQTSLSNADTALQSSDLVAITNAEIDAIIAS